MVQDQSPYVLLPNQERSIKWFQEEIANELGLLDKIRLNSAKNSHDREHLCLAGTTTRKKVRAPFYKKDR